MKLVSEQAIRRLIKYTRPCCNSCHEDEDYGYDLCTIDEELGKDRIAYVCCAVDQAFQEWYKKTQKSNHFY